MKKTNFLWGMLSMVMAAMLSVQLTSCGSDDKVNPEQPSQDPTSKIYTRPTNMLMMCYGLAFNYEHGANTKYFYDKLFSLEEYKLLTNQEVINKVATGNVSDRTLPNPDNYACWTGLRPNTEYVYVSVSFGQDGEQGEVITQHIFTKPSDSQPQVDFTDLTIEQPSTYTYYYKWTVARNTLCDQYYTYIAVCPTMFYAYYTAQQNATPLLAWALKREIGKNPRTHQSTSINDQSDVRDKFFSVKYNDGTERFECNLLQDRYFLIVAWGADRSGNLSGILNYSYIDLQSRSVQPNSYLQFSTPSQDNSNGMPQRIKLNIKDWEFIRAN